ncbi:hypothetical protein AWB85_21695 [Mycobacteroides immunogenum]|uniref:Uncharacterized protein n=1 Tax=Mycobacteroides immunogenum TaxID=83262 RepID=A0A179VBX4_9MYCO|nr:hypothetical protein AWB85_21695 [Mycobacteroides immunogenum]
MGNNMTGVRTTRQYAPAYLGPEGDLRVIGQETAWLPGAIAEVRKLNDERRLGESEVFVAYRDVPAYQRLEHVGVTLSDGKAVNGRWSAKVSADSDRGGGEIPSLAAIDDCGLAHYPWVVWTVELLDPGRLAGEDVAERTAVAATTAAGMYGCVYEYCVDEDTLADGTKYYKWYVGVTRAEHEHLVGNVPVVVAELVAALIGVLPQGVDADAHWTAGPDVYASRVRNEVDGGYPGIG